MQIAGNARIGELIGLHFSERFIGHVDDPCSQLCDAPLHLIRRLDRVDAASAHAAPVSADAPLNAAMAFDAGAFGAKDTMEIPLSIQTYGAGTIAR